jgi:hypothetical protein
VSCERFERALALDVSGDLPPREASALRAHLAGCARCCEFAAGLERSQAALRALADEDLPQDALRSVRLRVRAAAASEPRRWARRAPVWVWAAAASVVALAAGVVAWRVTTGPPMQVARAPERIGVPDPSGRVQAGGPQDDAQGRHPERAPSLDGRAKDLSTGPLRTHAAHAHSPKNAPARDTLDAALQRAESLCPEDADQLARALVYVSQLDGVLPAPDESSETEDTAKPPLALVRLATQDPNVVIYWQIDSDSNGG